MYHRLRTMCRYEQPNRHIEILHVVDMNLIVKASANSARYGQLYDPDSMLTKWKATTDHAQLKLSRIVQWSEIESEGKVPVYRERNNELAAGKTNTLYTHLLKCCLQLMISFLTEIVLICSALHEGVDCVLYRYIERN
jgi:hypothetical protein